METIFKGTYSEAAIVKSLIESNHIRVYSANENMAISLNVDGFQAVALSVDALDAPRALAIVRDYQAGATDSQQ